ncbi:MAG: NAD(P)H-dependent flavin oxidoreductase, partial [Pseudonocardia sp.]
EMADGTDRPWAVNLPLYRAGADEAIDLLLDRRPPVLIASQGGPRRYLQRFHDAGTTCLHVVAGPEHAYKAAEAGVDGLVVIGAGLAAMLALGGGAAQFGTRFLASEEATVHPAYKQAVLAATVDDTRTVGHGIGVIRAIANDFTARMTELEESGADIDVRHDAFRTATLKDAALHGDVTGGKAEAGQSAGLVASVLPAAEIVRRIAAEYAGARARVVAPHIRW